MPYRKDTEYLRGLNDEARVIKALKMSGHDVRPSTREENAGLDIDCWVGETAISIKSQKTAAKTGRIILELEVMEWTTCRGKAGSTDPDDYDYQWTSSWFMNGRADTYLILIGERLLKVNTSSLKELVTQALANSHPAVYILQGNNQKTVERQMRAGHKHHDAKSALVNTNYLVNQGLAQWITMPKTTDYQPEGLS